MIDLAPNHKLGLSVKNPILLAGGTIGYGEAVPRKNDLSLLGGVVVGPFLRSGRAGAAPPRLAETNGGFVLKRGIQSRGVAAAIKRHAKLWPKLGCPVIAQIADSDAEDVARVAERLGGVSGLSAIELLVSRRTSTHDLGSLVRATTDACDLPLWVKVPLASAETLASEAVASGADGVVVGHPLHGTLPAPDREQNGSSFVSGDLFGPLSFAPMLGALRAVASLRLPGTLIACGGIHTADQVEQALNCGADAVQIDSAFWIEPGLPARLAREISHARS